MKLAVSLKSIARNSITKCLMRKVTKVIGAHQWMLVLAAIGLFQAAVANAMITERITCIDGSMPYFLKTAENDNERSSPDVGVYIQDERNNLIQIFRGNISGHRLRGSILKQLSLTSVDKRYPILVVVNGRILVLTINTRLEDPSTYIDLGAYNEATGEGAPLKDIVTGRRIKLKDISSSHEVSVAMSDTLPGTSGNQGQVVLVSVKQQLPHGDGLTFAFFLKAGASSADKKLETLRSPVILDYKFQTEEELEKLIVARDHAVISRNLIDALTSEEDDDEKFLKSWKRKITSTLSILEGTAQSSSSTSIQATANSLPHYNLITGKQFVPVSPQFKLNASLGSKSLVLSQTMDLIQRTNTALLELDGGAKLALPGRFNFMEVRGSSEDSIQHYLNADSQAHLIFYHENHPYLLSSKTGAKLVELQLESSGKVAKKLSFYSRKLENDKEQFYLIVSYEYADASKETILYKIDDSIEKHPRILSRSKVSSEFYIQPELAARLIRYNQDFLFDNRTAPTASLNEYVGEFNSDLAYLDLKSSTDGKLISRYPHVAEDRGISLFGSDGGLFLQWGDIKELKTTHMIYQQATVSRLSFIVKKIDSDDTSENAVHTYYIFISADFGKVQETKVIVMQGKQKKDHVQNLEKVREYKLNSEFFAQESLRQRVSVAEDGNVLFDDITSRDIHTSLYSDSYIRSGMHIDVSSSGAEKIVKRLREPALTQEFGPYELRVYELDGVVGEPSGIYTTEVSGADKDKVKKQAHVLGEPLALRTLKANTDLEEKKYILATTSFLIPESDKEKEKVENSAERATIFLGAMDANYKNGLGQHGFHFNLAVKHRSERHGIQKILQKIPVNIPWSRFQGAYLKEGTKDQAGMVYLFLNFKDLYEGEKLVSPGMIHMLSFEFSRKQSEKGKIILTQKDSRTLNKVQISMEELESRVVTDSKGRVYFEMTPDTDRSDLEYEIYSLADNKIERPNAGGRNGDIKIEAEGFPAYRKGNAWRIHSSTTNRDEIKALKDKDLSEYRQDLFTDVTEVLKDMVEPSSPAKHVAILTDKALKAYVKDMILARYIDDFPSAIKWSFKNTKAPLYLFNPKEHGSTARGELIRTQDPFFENMEGIREADGRPVLMADLKDILGLAAVGAGRNHGQVLHYRNGPTIDDDPEYDDDANDEALNASDVRREDRHPHGLYLLAEEGDKVDLEDFRKKKAKPRIPMLFVGTKDEWERLKREAAIEARYGLFESFEVKELQVPSVEARMDLVRKELDRAEINQMRLTYEPPTIEGAKAADNISNEEAKNQLIKYLVQRSEKLADPKGQEERAAPKEGEVGKDVFLSFIKAKNLFMKSLLRDDEIQKSRIVDRSYIDRLMPRIFDVPLSLRILKDSDPLKKLNSPRAIIEWQKAGYGGPFELKQKIIDVIMSQLRKSKTVKVPASVMIMGSTRSGKTFMFDTLIKMLGVKQYNFNTDDYSENDDAGAIKIEAQKIDEGAAGSGSGSEGDNDMRTLEEMITHLDHFLTLRNGYRGFILIDDIHLLSSKDRGSLLKYLRTLLESDFYVRRSKFSDSAPVERPTRNLQIFLTFNPTEDVERIKKIVPNYYPGYTKITPEDLAKATLLTEDMPTEGSWLTRFGLILPLNTYPVQAKGPGLIKEMADIAKDSLENDGKVILLTTETVNGLSQKFPDENAKAFNATSISKLSEIAEKATDDGSRVTILVPKKSVGKSGGARATDWAAPQQPQWGIGERDKEKITIGEYVEQNVDVVKLDDGFAGKLHLTKMIVDKFRTKVYEEFVSELGQSEKIAGSAQLQQILLAPTLRALGRHINEKEILPLSVLRLDTHVMGATRQLQKDQFNSAIGAIEERHSGDFFPFDMERSSQLEGLLDAMTTQADISNQRGPNDLFKDVTLEVESIMETGLKKALRVSSIAPFPDSQSWLSSLKVEDTNKTYKEIAVRLVDSYENFMDRVFHRESPMMASLMLSHYDLSRIFAFIVDRAIAKQPWAHATMFLSQSLLHLSQDLALAQSPGVQSFIYGDPQSILRPTTKDLVTQMILSSSAMKQISDDTEKQNHENFRNICENSLKRRAR